MEQISTILAYDSNNWVLLYQELLKRAGYKVLTATNRKDALKILETQKIDLAIGEFSSSSEEPREIISESFLKNLHEKSIPFILITGSFTSIKEITRLFRLGAMDVFIKREKISLDEIEKAIVRVLGSKKEIGKGAVEILEKITLNLDNSWTARDFSVLIGAVQFIYTFLFITMQDRVQGFSKQTYPNLKEFVEFRLEEIYHYPLRVTRVQYASPGMISFDGLGEPIKELRELIESLAFIVVRWKKEKADLILKEKEIEQKNIEIRNQEFQIERTKQKAEYEDWLELEEKRLEILEKKVNLLKEMGYPEKEIQQLLVLVNENIYGLAQLYKNDKLSLPNPEQ